MESDVRERRDADVDSGAGADVLAGLGPTLQTQPAGSLFGEEGAARSSRIQDEPQRGRAVDHHLHPWLVARDLDRTLARRTRTGDERACNDDRKTCDRDDSRYERALGH